MRALIVDDSRAMRRIEADLMKQLGFETADAVHGKDALEKLIAGPRPDVVLVDWNMPEMNGLELIRSLRARPEFANLPLMMVTTETEMEQMVTALEAGANEYVMKPFGKETLAEKLQLLGLGAA